MVFLGGGQPHSVVCCPIALVAEDEDNLVLNVDREAAKHGASLGRQRSDRVEHELMRDLPLVIAPCPRSKGKAKSSPDKKTGETLNRT